MLYAALAFDPPLDFVSLDPPVEPEPPDELDESEDDFELPSLFVVVESVDSFFASDFESLELELESVDELFFEP